MADAEAELRAEEEELQTLKDVLEEMDYEDEAEEKGDESKWDKQEGMDLQAEKSLRETFFFHI